MNSYHSLLLIECIERERQERLRLATDRWYLTGQGAQGSPPAELLAGALVALARWLAPRHPALVAGRG